MEKWSEKTERYRISWFAWRSSDFLVFPQEIAEIHPVRIITQTQTQLAPPVLHRHKNSAYMQANAVYMKELVARRDSR